MESHGMEFLEFLISGRHYEAVLTTWSDERIYCKVYRQPAFSGWLSREAVLAAMVKDDKTHRCCNVHGERLVKADGSGLSPEALAASQKKAEEHGKLFMTCPWLNCDVGLWSGSSSLPGTAELRRLRSEVFQLLRSDQRLVADRAIKHGIINNDASAPRAGAYLAIGCLNVKECEALLGLAGAVLIGEDEVDEPIESVRRRIPSVPRSVEFE